MLSDCFTQNTNTCNHTCDYSEATLIFLPPNGCFSPASSLSLYGSGYLAAIHPELMCRAASGLKRQHPSFFDYHTDEALHLSLRESDQIRTLFNLMDHELRHPVDNCTETILSHHLQLFSIMSAGIMHVSSLHVNTRTRFFCKKQKNSLIPASVPACQKEEIPLPLHR